MKIIKTSIPEVLTIEPVVFGDPRGFFMELFPKPSVRGGRYCDFFVQDNLSRSTAGVLRGLHLQKSEAARKACDCAARIYS